jgi:hypothetical protein
MKKLILIIGLLNLSVIINAQQTDFPKLEGPYLGQKPPGMTPEIFAPGVLSTGMIEGALALSPDGKECYWTIHTNGLEVIAMSKLENNLWTNPEVAKFSGKYLDGFPSFHPDGSRLYFHSFRPTGDKLKFPAKLNIWFVERIGNEWSDPILVDYPVNSAGNSACPSVAQNGNLYFSKKMPAGEELVVCSQLVNGKFTEPVPLPDNVNTTKDNFHARVAPDESYIIIPRAGRSDNLGAAWNYYVSFRDEKGEWGELRNLGFRINNPRTLVTPSLSADGKYFFFAASTPSVYCDSLDRKYNLKELQERETSLPINDRGDVFWVETTYIDAVKILEFTNLFSAMVDIIEKKDVKAAIDLYWKAKIEHPQFYDLSESMLNHLGYTLLGTERYKEAIEILKLNTEVFPDSWNVYDSLGEAYMIDGKTEDAILNYQKSLVLNPENVNAKKKLEQLEGK